MLLQREPGCVVLLLKGTNNPEDGISVDQLAARTLGGETPFPSLELSTSGANGGSYSSTIAFRTPTQPSADGVESPQTLFSNVWPGRYCRGKKCHCRRNHLFTGPGYGRCLVSEQGAWVPVTAF